MNRNSLWTCSLSGERVNKSQGDGRESSLPSPRDFFTPSRNREAGRDPFNQNFRKFRTETQWIGSVQPGKFRKKLGCLPFDRKIRLGCRKHNGKRLESKKRANLCSVSLEPRNSYQPELKDFLKTYSSVSGWNFRNLRNFLSNGKHPLRLLRWTTFPGWTGRKFWLKLPPQYSGWQFPTGVEGGWVFGVQLRSQR